MVYSEPSERLLLPVAHITVPKLEIKKVRRTRRPRRKAKAQPLSVEKEQGKLAMRQGRIQLIASREAFLEGLQIMADPPKRFRPILNGSPSSIHEQNIPASDF
ncbi:hypothetical protein FRB94_013236 [Tulasnella sp. JGI-2019a]|nr:hypothetical protein FRB94_013236 [Tulasnella sp. JGI-2019a]